MLRLTRRRRVPPRAASVKSKPTMRCIPTRTSPNRATSSQPIRERRNSETISKPSPSSTSPLAPGSRLSRATAVHRPKNPMQVQASSGWVATIALPTHASAAETAPIASHFSGEGRRISVLAGAGALIRRGRSLQHPLEQFQHPPVLVVPGVGLLVGVAFERIAGQLPLVLAQFDQAL